MTVKSKTLLHSLKTDDFRHHKVPLLWHLSNSSHRLQLTPADAIKREFSHHWPFLTLFLGGKKRSERLKYSWSVSQKGEYFKTHFIFLNVTTCLGKWKWRWEKKNEELILGQSDLKFSTVLKVHHQVLVPFMSLSAWDPRVTDCSHRLESTSFPNLQQVSIWHSCTWFWPYLLHFTSCWLLLSHSIPRVSGDFVTI